MIRLTVPSIDEEDLDAVRSALASGFLVQGKHVAEFERMLTEKVGVPHAVAVSNGTCALHLALCTLGVKRGDICVVPAYSWVATANVVEHCGARPIFVDIDRRSFNIDVHKLEETLGSLMDDPATAPLVRAVIPVHAFGMMAEMRAINEICGRWDIPVVEDAACALGASLHSQQAGSWGAMGCFSFHPRKAVTTGEGGAVTTRDSEASSKLRALRNHGQDPDASSQDFIFAGFNYRLTEFQGALGEVQMSKLDRIVGKRVKAASRYDELLADSALEIPYVMPDSCHVYQSYVTLLPEKQASARGELIRSAREAGIELQIGTIHMPLTSYYRRTYGFSSGDFPATDSVSARALTLPLYESITLEDQQAVARFLLESVS